MSTLPIPRPRSMDEDAPLVKVHKHHLRAEVDLYDTVRNLALVCEVLLGIVADQADPDTVRNAYAVVDGITAQGPAEAAVRNAQNAVEGNKERADKTVVAIANRTLGNPSGDNSFISTDRRPRREMETMATGKGPVRVPTGRVIDSDGRVIEANE